MDHDLKQTNPSADTVSPTKRSFPAPNLPFSQHQAKCTQSWCFWCGKPDHLPADSQPPPPVLSTQLPSSLLDHPPRANMLSVHPSESNTALTSATSPHANLEPAASISMAVPSAMRLTMALENVKPEPDPRMVVTPLSPDCTEALLCKFNILPNWEHIVYGLHYGFGVNNNPSKSHIFHKSLFLKPRPILH